MFESINAAGIKKCIRKSLKLIYRAVSPAAIMVGISFLDFSFFAFLAKENPLIFFQLLSSRMAKMKLLDYVCFGLASWTAMWIFEKILSLLTEEEKEKLNTKD